MPLCAIEFVERFTTALFATLTVSALVPASEPPVVRLPPFEVRETGGTNFGMTIVTNV